MKTIAKIIHNNTFPLNILDSNGNTLYREYIAGFWYKQKYDNGKEIYYENSTGYIMDKDIENNWQNNS